jgi:glycosyltransferase involved in cell wall biosynthesis
MVIGIDCRLINNKQNTGISRYTEFLIEYYVFSFGVKNVYLITNDKNYHFKGCRTIYTKLKPFNLVHFFFYSKFVRSLGVDIYHVPFYSCFFRKVDNVKNIVTVHDLMYCLVNNFFGRNYLITKFKVNYFNFIVKHTLSNADLIISVSETTKKDVLQTYGYDSIHIPEESEIRELADPNILDRFNLKKGGYFFYCGNNRPHKNISFIIDIFKSNPHLPVLVLAGKGHENSSNVISVGVVSDEELKALYKFSLAFVFPSLYEGFGLPVLEALRCQTIVIASEIPAFLEFRSKNILFFKLGNKEIFLNAINRSMLINFQNEESFFDSYSKKRIYNLNDLMLDRLLN